MDFLIAHRVYECGIHQEKTSTRSNSVHWKSNCSMHFTTPRPITGKVDLCRCRPPPTRMAGNVDVVGISIVALLFYYSSIREFMAISRPGINYCSIWALYNSIIIVAGELCNIHKTFILRSLHRAKLHCGVGALKMWVSWSTVSNRRGGRLFCGEKLRQIQCLMIN